MAERKNLFEDATAPDSDTVDLSDDLGYSDELCHQAASAYTENLQNAHDPHYQAVSYESAHEVFIFTDHKNQKCFVGKDEFFLIRNTKYLVLLCEQAGKAA